jgi:hypothetical protein
LQCKLIKPSAIGAVKAALQQLVEREAGKGKGPTPAANNVKSDSGATETVRPSSRHGLRAAGRLQVEEGRSSRGDWGDGAEGLERRSKDLEAAGSCADEANKGKGAAEASSAQRSTDATKCGEGAETAGRQGEEGCRTRGHTSSKGRKHKNSDKKSRRDQMSSVLPPLFSFLLLCGTLCSVFLLPCQMPTRCCGLCRQIACILNRPLVSCHT